MPLIGVGPLEADRRDFHNVSINVDLAAAGYCGMTHLATGRVCTRPARHTGSCDFRVVGDVAALVADPPASGPSRARS